MKQRLAILGSTGSIGVQTLDIARENPGRFEVRVLTANRNWERLARQAREFDADAAVIADKQHYAQLRDALAGTDTKVYAGEEAVAQVAAGGGTDVVVNALVGYAGLAPTVAAIEAGKKLALANKESLVVGGACVMPLARERKAPVIPIDSEHSAIFQCLVGERAPVRRLIVTCSGGAFRDFRAEELANVTVEQALRHPQWDMGAKITIDSSTLVNKGFEVIEAHWLFGTPAERISVLLHPQSIIHSMVEFEDGAIKAQLGTPDMRLPISFALLYPDRANRPGERFNFLNHPQLTFAEVDRAKYPALDIAYDCLRRGGTAACTMNGANEVAVAAFLARKCAWLDIVRAIRYALEHAAFVPSPTLADYAGQPIALDVDTAPAANFVQVQRLPLAPTFIKYEAHGQTGADGLRGALYVEYYECITPQLAQTMYREGKTNGLHNFPETAADAANGFLYCRTLVDGNKVLRVLLFQYQEEQIPLQELEAICKSGFAASGESA